HNQERSPQRGGVGLETVGRRNREVRRRQSLYHGVLAAAFDGRFGAVVKTQHQGAAGWQFRAGCGGPDAELEHRGFPSAGKYAEPLEFGAEVIAQPCLYLNRFGHLGRRSLSRAEGLMQRGRIRGSRDAARARSRSGAVKPMPGYSSRSLSESQAQRSVEEST